MSLQQPLEPTGHRKPGEAMESLEHRRKGAALPEKDANANKSYFGPGGLLKGSGSGRHKTGLEMNRKPVGSAGRFQKARRRK